MTTIVELLLTLDEGSDLNLVNPKMRTPTSAAVDRTTKLLERMDKDYLYLAWKLYWYTPAGVLAILNIDGGICRGIQPMLDKMIKHHVGDRYWDSAMGVVGASATHYV